MLEDETGYFQIGFTTDIQYLTASLVGNYPSKMNNYSENNYKFTSAEFMAS